MRIISHTFLVCCGSPDEPSSGSLMLATADSLEDPTVSGVAKVVFLVGGIAVALGVTLDCSLGVVVSNCWDVVTAGVLTSLTSRSAVVVFISLSEHTYVELLI